MKEFDHKRHEAAWLKVLLGEMFPDNKFFLYGSVSKIPDYSFDTLYDPIIPDITFDDKSDFDFATDDDKIERRLLELGWEEKSDSSYQDTFTQKVFEGTLNNKRVQVSVKQDFDMFVQVWNTIPTDFYWEYLNKRSVKAMPKPLVAGYLNQLHYVAKYISPSKNKISFNAFPMEMPAPMQDGLDQVVPGPAREVDFE